MVEFEADDALATAAARWGDAPDVEQVLICTPDKDMTQCVRDGRIVCFDRMRRKMIDEARRGREVRRPAGRRFADWLALVGDSADGYPGVAALGREVGGSRAGALRTPRSDSRTANDSGA